jgi:hypothetical protein
MAQSPITAIGVTRDCTEIENQRYEERRLIGHVALATVRSHANVPEVKVAHWPSQVAVWRAIIENAISDIVLNVTVN